MSSETTRTTEPKQVRRRRSGGGASLMAHGEPMVWLTGGALAVALFMILGLLLLVFVQGFTTFWPDPIVKITAGDDVRLGEVTRTDDYALDPAKLKALTAEQRAKVEAIAPDHVVVRRLLRIGNYEITNEHFNWIDDFTVTEESRPEWAILVERLENGRFYGELKGFEVDGKSTASTPAEAWAEYEKHHGDARARYHERKRLEKDEIGVLNHAVEAARLDMRAARLESGEESDDYRAAKKAFETQRAATQTGFAAIRKEIVALEQENDRYHLVFDTVGPTGDREVRVKVSDVVRAYPANQIGFAEKLGIYTGRWWEFLVDEPREANSEGGVWPAIFGTVVMTLIMCLFVVPFGVLAALYLREYAKGGPIVSAVRIAINNLAGVPSIVFGVFGLGFFCYIMGVGIDELFFAAKLPNPTYGKGGVLWASLTLALLTLPVVIVATEEALSAVPNSMREGSYACGASKWQTIKRIVLPRAMPGIMTGMILAMARGAGEVAPLMLVGAVKLAPELPMDGFFPYLHPERSFMHLGFHIYDLGFQSQNSEAAKPMVYTTTLLLIGIVASLNLAAIWLRARLSRRFVSGQF